MAWDEAKQTLGTPQVLVPRDGTYNFYYPAWSPDGEWVAYNRTVGGGYASAQAEVMLVKSDGSIDLRLDLANGEGRCRTALPPLGPAARLGRALARVLLQTGLRPRRLWPAPDLGVRHRHRQGRTRPRPLQRAVLAARSVHHVRQPPAVLV
ncbi:MAG: PD40 domain-containing protein, partial [Deltaproteobacteria bacterium]|nr:PD40 domain-containing protein [Deltaproteobacteria bacterium]